VSLYTFSIDDKVTYKAKTPLKETVSFRANVKMMSEKTIEVHGSCYRAADPSRKILAEAVGIYTPRSIRPASSPNIKSKL
jgi:hypothetical protein